jgi:hypothetical protein
LRATVPIAALYGLLPIGFAAGLPLPAIVVVAAAGSLGALTFGGVFQTMVQLHFPEQVLSRVSAYEWFGGLVAYPAGLALAGPLAEAIGIGPVLWSAGAVQLVLVLALLLVPAVRNLTAPAEPGRDGPALAERNDAAWTELSGGGKEQLDGSW